MAYGVEADPLCYPDTTVLRNKLDIRNQAELDEFELALFLVRSDEPVPFGNFDFAHYRAVHRHLFQDVYEWAGEIRTIRIGKDGNWFCYPEHIEREMDRIFATFSIDSLTTEISADDFSRIVAHVIAEINAVHPFREGNGRTQLTFLAMLAERCGYTFDTQAFERDRVIDAMVRSFAGDEGPLQALILDLVT